MRLLYSRAQSIFPSNKIDVQIFNIPTFISHGLFFASTLLQSSPVVIGYMFLACQNHA